MHTAPSYKSIAEDSSFTYSQPRVYSANKINPPEPNFIPITLREQNHGQRPFFNQVASGVNPRRSPSPIIMHSNLTGQGPFAMGRPSHFAEKPKVNFTIGQAAIGRLPRYY